MIQSRAFERKRLIKVLLLQAEKVEAPEQGMRRVAGEFLCFFLDIFLDRELGKVRSEFHHVAVGRGKNKDDRTASPSLDFVGMMHHDAASWCGSGCGLAQKQNSSRHVMPPILQEQSSVGNAGSKHACVLAGTRLLPS